MSLALTFERLWSPGTVPACAAQPPAEHRPASTWGSPLCCFGVVVGLPRLPCLGFGRQAVCNWVMCFGSLCWREHVLLSSECSEQAPAMLLTGCVLASLPCILMKDITLFSPSPLGQDTLCLLCLFLPGLLVDPGLPWSGPFLLNGSGGCVDALSCFQFGI